MNVNSQSTMTNAESREDGQQVLSTQTERLSVPLRISSPIPFNAGCQPITVGVPLPKGRCHEPLVVSLVGPDDRAVSVQAAPLALWSDGSVKWLLADLMAPALPEGTSDFTLLIGEDNDTEPRNSANGMNQGVQVHFDDTGHVLRVDTGPVTFDIDRRRFLPFLAVNVASGESAGGVHSETILTDRRGRERVPHVESIDVESSGTLRTTLLIRGYFARCRGLRFAARLSFYAGTGLVQIRFTVHNPNRAKHRGGLWDLGDSGSILFDDLSLAFRTGLKPTAVLWKISTSDPPQSLDGGFLEIYQDSSGGENWQSRNHVNRNGRVPCRFQGFRVQADATETSGLRAAPIVAVESEALRLAVSVPEFWQQFPKALEVDHGTLRVRLFPKQWDDLFELQGGEQKTHTVWLRYGSGTEDIAAALDWTHCPARAVSTPKWYAESGAIANLSPAESDPDDRLCSYADESLSGEMGFIAKREVIDEYGWRNYGDVWADHEQAYFDGSKPVISHYNNQFDVVYGAILQMMRSGDNAWFDVFDPLARHVVDIDVYRTEKDRAAYSGGLFWFTDHYLDAATSTHRTYSRSNLPSGGRPYGGGPGSEHNFATGLLHYYYLTGDLDARDTVIGLARWVIAMDDGACNVLGIVDDGPTGLASCCGGMDYHGPGRGAGNSIEVLLDGWLASGDKSFLVKAEELIRRCIHPDDDIDARQLLDAEKRWSYTMFLSALARFLDVKTECGQLDKMYAYGRTALLRYARWMVDHERPYLDRPAELEYPTEAWAAQEFRKANVFLLAARHAGEPARRQMLARFRELSDRAWRDLMSFDSRHATRAVAVVLKEGTIGQFPHQAESTPMSPSPDTWEFDTPTRFVPQRHRVTSHMLSLTGIIGLAMKMMMPTRWMSVLQRRSRY